MLWCEGPHPCDQGRSEVEIHAEGEERENDDAEVEERENNDGLCKVQEKGHEDLEKLHVEEESLCI